MISPSGNNLTSVKFHLYLYDDNRWIVKVDAKADTLPKYLVETREGSGISNLIETMTKLREMVRDYDSRVNDRMRRDISEFMTEVAMFQAALTRMLDHTSVVDFGKELRWLKESAEKMSKKAAKLQKDKGRYE